MDKGIQDVIKTIADDVQELMRTVSGDKRATTRIAGNSVVADAFYENFLEWDGMSRTGKQSSVSDIKDWALGRGLPTDNKTINRIRRIVWQDGHSGQPLLVALEKEIDLMMEKEWSDMITDWVVKELEKILG